MTHQDQRTAPMTSPTTEARERLLAWSRCEVMIHTDELSKLIQTALSPPVTGEGPRRAVIGDIYS